MALPPVETFCFFGDIHNSQIFPAASPQRGLKSNLLRDTREYAAGIDSVRPRRKARLFLSTPFLLDSSGGRRFRKIVFSELRPPVRPFVRACVRACVRAFVLRVC